MFFFQKRYYNEIQKGGELMNDLYLQLTTEKERKYNEAKWALQQAFELFKKLEEPQKQKLFNELAFEAMLKSYFHHC